MVLERMEQLDEEFLANQRDMQIGTEEGTGRLKEEDYESYKAWLLGQYPPRWLKLPDGTITFDSPAVMLLRDYPHRVLNHDKVWPEIKKALGVR